MTVDRYAFTEDFQIVDQPTGQTRSPQTLSGGETFLASLSLALGLVELAGRSGGLVESLFLDEGFGALDANALDDAISALETHVASGRMVTIVSHLRSIAERIDPLLLVTKDAMGSHAQWVTGAERERLLDTELETGLVA
jgi:exonuclease SbcC